LATVGQAGAFLTSNAVFRDAVGRSVAELSGLVHCDLVSDDDKARVDDAFRAVADGHQRSVALSARYWRPDGTTIAVELAFEALDSGDEAPAQILVQAVNLIARDREFFGTVFDRAPVSLAIISPDGTFAHVNEAGCELTGYSEEELSGALVTLVIHPESVGPAVDVLGALLTGNEQHARLELKILRRDGSQRDVEIAATAVYNPSGELGYLVGLAQDLTERHKLEEEVRHRAAHDHLTELPNRQWFIQRLGQALARARRDHSMLAVFFIDLDGFKPINDSLGHHAGDEVLFSSAGRISRVVRPEDTLARYGGDEFTILCEQLPGEADAEEIARRVLGSFERSFLTSEGEAALTASVGVALVTKGRSSPAAVLEAADGAMYESKRAGKATYRVVRVGSRPGPVDV
jgi:diguanylate cyclase (GGDEF)-like protein/PAS domain S-box-containing protein